MFCNSEARAGLSHRRAVATMPAQLQRRRSRKMTATKTAALIVEGDPSSLEVIVRLLSEI